MSDAGAAELRWAAAGVLTRRSDVRLDLTFNLQQQTTEPAPLAAWVALREVRRSLSGSVRVVVLRTDPALFSQPQSAPADEAELELLQQACDWASDPAYVSVAVLRGATVGAGLQLAVGCDLRVAAADAVLGLTEPGRHGLPALGVTQSLVRAVGYASALDLAVTGRLLPAREAQAVGLVQHVAEPHLLESRVEALVAGLLAPDRDTVREIKALLLRAEYGSREGQGTAERAAQLRLQAQGDRATES